MAGRSRVDEDEEYGSAREVTEDAADDKWKMDPCLREDLIEAAEELEVELVEGAGEWVRAPKGRSFIGVSMSWGVVPISSPIFLAER